MYAIKGTLFLWRVAIRLLVEDVLTFLLFYLGQPFALNQSFETSTT
jgi:hypothetical protein